MILLWKAYLDRCAACICSLACFSGGLGTREMAEAMNISPKTVATHRGRIKVKLGIGSTPELVRRAVRWVDEQMVAAGEEPSRDA